jgi:hypothetical protein
MAMQTLTLETLGLIDDGRAALICNRAFAEAVEDLSDRGSDSKPREVTIKVKLLQQGEDRYSIEVEAGVKRPGWKTAAHAALVGGHRGTDGKKVADLRFQEFGTDDPTQTRIEDRDQPQE